MLTRRNFIRGAGALTALSLAPKPASALGLSGLKEQPVRILPKRLKPGDTIGLITPSGPINKQQLDDAVSQLKSLGFNTYYEKSVLDQYGYFAGKDADRAAELNKMFGNEKVDAILCVRGGYGAIRILDMLDYDLIKNNPKIFMGYSDITAFLNAIHERTGLVTFHGPLGISPFNDFVWNSFNKVVMNPKNHYKYPYQREPGTEENPEFDRYTINKGRASGKLVGGNISVLASMIGSGFEPDFENKIVFLEEIEEKTYRVDKMLVHMLQATNLKKAAGIVFGVFNECNINDEPRLTLKQAIADLFSPLKMPVSYGFPFGHIDTIITLPIGIHAHFSAAENRLKLMEKAVT
jgi:muramoyltetrapeptide carboxypeptidase